MITIITALGAEAQPFIDKYMLRQTTNPYFLHYQNQNIELLVSGMTPCSSAVATAYILSQKPSVQKTVLNFGICGSHKQEEKIGQGYQINKIIDATTQKVFHIKNKKILLPTASVTTFYQPQNKKSRKQHLVDMESSGFYMAAKKFIPPKNIYLFKVVSDHVDNKILEKMQVASMIEPYLSIIDQL